MEKERGMGGGEGGRGRGREGGRGGGREGSKEGSDKEKEMGGGGREGSGSEAGTCSAACMEVFMHTLCKCSSGVVVYVHSGYVHVRMYVRISFP